MGLLPPSEVQTETANLLRSRLHAIICTGCLLITYVLFARNILSEWRLPRGSHDSVCGWTKYTCCHM